MSIGKRIGIYFLIAFFCGNIGWAGIVPLASLPSVDQAKIRDSWLSQHNTERKALGLTPYTSSKNLDKTAQVRADYLATLNASTHKRFPASSYYNYNEILAWFKQQGVTFGNKLGTSFSESIGRRIYSCKKADCTPTLLDAMKKVFAFFMSEKYKKSQPHYKGIVMKHYTQIGLGVAYNTQTKKIFVVTHYGTMPSSITSGGIVKK